MNSVTSYNNIGLRCHIPLEIVTFAALNDKFIDTMISVEGLKVEFNATPLFEDVSYVINKKDRIARWARMVRVSLPCSRYWPDYSSPLPASLPFPENVLSVICRR